MLTLRLPDGSAKQVPDSTRPREVAEGIGKRLAQAAVAAKVNGTIIDLDREILPPPQPSPARGEGAHTSPSPLAGEGWGEGGDISFQILTEKDREALDVLRHSCAHVMARAVMRLFPGAKLAF